MRVDVTRLITLSHVTLWPLALGEAAADTRAVTQACADMPVQRWGQPDKMLLRYLDAQWIETEKAREKSNKKRGVREEHARDRGGLRDTAGE